MNLLTSLAEFFYPERCLVCGKNGAIVHQDCEKQLPYVKEPFCHACSKPLEDAHCHSLICKMNEQEKALYAIRSIFWHQAAGREAVLRLKYRGVSSLSDWAAHQVAKNLQAAKLSNQFDLIMAVPLHAQRLQKRGYNQAAIVATKLAPKLDRPYQEGQLIRAKATRSQVELNAKERERNVRNAFVWQGKDLQGQTILLFDDVCTTGATLNQCARVLKEAGAGDIWAITLTQELLKRHV